MTDYTQYTNNTFRLKADHYNLKGKLYNKAGDVVRVTLAESNTVIVENKAGERYAINLSKLQIEDVR